MIPQWGSVLGVRCYERLEDIPGNIDIVQVYSGIDIDLLGAAQGAVEKAAKGFWIEDDQAPEAVRRILHEARVYIVEYESLEREFRKNCLPPSNEPVAAKPNHTLTVSERMTRNPITIKARESLQEALAKMKKGHFRHLPVVGEDDRLVGMLSDRDLRLIHPSSVSVPYEKIMEQLATIRVEQAATFSPVVLLHDATLEEAAEMMLRWEVGALPVIAGDSHLVGINTYSDLLRELVARREPPRASQGSSM